MTITAARVRPTATARRWGYVVAVIVNAIVFYAANVWPGWQALPFVTADMALVIGFVNASILASLAANVVYLVSDPPWVKALGDLLTSTVGLVAAVRMWQVFPFDFAAGAFDWAPVVRVLLLLCIVGGAIAIVVAVARFFRSSQNQPDMR